MNSFALAGLRVDCDVDLPQLVTWPGSMAGALADIQAREAPRQWRCQADVARGATPEPLLLTIPGALQCRLDGGDDILYARLGAVDAQDIGVFLTDIVLPICLMRRGEVILRAAVVHDGAEATVLVGAAGVGKSALACALVDQGMALLCDGYCRVVLDAAGRPAVVSSGLGLRLRADTFELLQIAHQRGARLRSAVDRFFVQPQAAAAGNTALPLRRLYMLQGLGAARNKPPTPASRLDTLRGLHAYAFRESLVSMPQQRRHYFATAAAVDRHAEAFSLSCAWGGTALREMARALADAMEARGR